MTVEMGLSLFTEIPGLEGEVTLKVNGVVAGVTETVRKMTLKPKTKKYIDFSFVINNISTNYTNLQLVLESSKLDTIIKFRLVSG